MFDEWFTGKELMEMELPEISWAVPGLLPEGLVLFAGKQKIGKSFFLLNLGLAVAGGKEVISGMPIEKGRVLYLALEDGLTRLQSRLDKMLDGGVAPRELMFVTRSKKLLEGGLEDIEEFLVSYPDTRLVMIDVWQSMKPKHKQNADAYEEAYEYLTPLKRLAEEHHVSIVVVQHMRKSSAVEVVDEIYGSTGISAVADNIVVLSKESNGGRFLTVKGRDIQERKYALEFDEQVSTWRVIASDEQAEELCVASELAHFIRLVEASHGGITRLEASRRLQKTLDGIDSLARRAVKEGKIKRDRGTYCPVRVPALAGIDDDRDPD